VVCAAPEYWAAHAAPRTPEELRDHACLAYRRPRNGRVRQWRFSGSGGVRTLPVQSALTFNSNEALVAAAVAGMGVIQVAEFYAREAIDDGDLVEVLADQRAGGYEISVLFPPQQHMTPKHRVFVDFLVDIFRHPRWTRA
jgi:LysR family transcriptional regulator for bpeEF and oprC